MQLDRSRKAIYQRAAELGLPRRRNSGSYAASEERLSACKPTTASPGTPEKIEVLRKRAAAKQHLWHPGDPTVTPADADRVVYSLRDVLGYED